MWRTAKAPSLHISCHSSSIEAHHDGAIAKLDEHSPSVSSPSLSLCTRADGQRSPLWAAISVLAFGHCFTCVAQGAVRGFGKRW